MIHKPTEGICGRASAIEAMSIREESKITTSKDQGIGLSLTPMISRKMTVAEREDDLKVLGPQR